MVSCGCQGDRDRFLDWTEHDMTGYSAFVDFCLAILPWKILWTLQMKRHEKIGAAVGMSLGLVAGAIGVAKVVNILTVTTTANIPCKTCRRPCQCRR